MITFNQTVGLDKNAIFVLKIELDSQTFYFSNAEDKITLSSIDFDGKVILSDNGLSSLIKEIDCTRGGTLGQVGYFDFSLSRYTDFSGFSDFFDDFFPNNSVYLSGRFVHIGVVWSGATTTSEITWLRKFVIRNYNYNNDFMNFNCDEYTQIYQKRLPYYKVQTKEDNGVSYFADAPEYSIDEIIPIVYGSFATENFEYSDFLLSPALLINKREFEYLVSSHPCHTVCNSATGGAGGVRLYQYVKGADSAMTIEGVSGKTSLTNTERGHIVKLNTNGSAVWGELILQLKKYLDGSFQFDVSVASVDFAGTDIDNLSDSDSSSFASVGIDETAALQLNTDTNGMEIGNLTYSGDSSVSFNILWNSSDSNTQYIQLSYYHPELGVNSGFAPDPLNDSTNSTQKTSTFNFGDGTHGDTWGSNPKKWQNWQIWSIEELQRLLFCIYNKNTSTASIKVYNAYLKITDISVYFRIKGGARRTLWS